MMTASRPIVVMGAAKPHAATERATVSTGLQEVKNMVFVGILLHQRAVAAFLGRTRPDPHAAEDARRWLWKI